MTTQSKADEVFRIYELTALILQHIDLSDWLQLQYINRTTLAVASKSHPFRRFCFLESAVCGTIEPKPAPTTKNPKRVRWFLKSTDAELPQNPHDPDIHDVSSLIRAFGRLTTATGHASTRSRPFEATPMLSPLLKKHFPKWSYYALNNMIGLERRLPYCDIWRRPEASWRAQLLMQPPLAFVNVIDWDGKEYKVSNEKGITMGDIMDAVYNGGNGYV